MELNGYLNYRVMVTQKSWNTEKLSCGLPRDLALTDWYSQYGKYSPDYQRIKITTNSVVKSFIHNSDWPT